MILSGLGLTSIPEAIINLYHGQKVTHLDLSFNDLKSVEGLSLFKHLESLVLDNNRLTMIGGGFDEYSRPVRIVNSQLKVLSLNNNRITNLDSFLRNISICFPNLTYLSLLRNPCCPDDLSSKWAAFTAPWLMGRGDQQYREYREKCERALPRLQFLDSTDIKKNKLVHSKSFEQQIVENLMKFTNGLKEVFTEDERPPPASPLPKSQRNPGDHHGVYLKKRTEYTGKQSEGNRFIGNSQL